MKKISKHYALYIILTMLTIITASCGDSERMRQMTDADAMIGRRSYDSAIARLNTIDTTRLTDREWAYYHLLETTAKQKSYISIGTDTIINKVIDYYNRYGSSDEIARAYLCKGTYFADKDSLEITIYNLKIAEQNAKDPLLRYEIIAKIASCNIITMNFASALEQARKGLKVSGDNGNRRWQGVYYNILLRCYQEKSEEDSVSKYAMLLENTLDAQPKKDYGVYSYYVAKYYHKHSENEKAIEILKKSIEIDPQCANYYLLATIYDEENRSEEAEKMWQEALKEKEDYLKAPIMEEYSAWLQRQGRTIEAAQITEEARKLNEIVKSKNYQNQERILKVQTDFDKKQEVEKKQKAVVIVSVAAAIAIVLIVMLWLRKYRKGQDLTRKLQQVVNGLQQEITKYEADLKLMNEEKDQKSNEKSKDDDEFKRSIRALQRKVRDKTKALEKLELSLKNNMKELQQRYKRGEMLRKKFFEKKEKKEIKEWNDEECMSYLFFSHMNNDAVGEITEMLDDGRIKLKTAVCIVLCSEEIDKEDIKQALNLSETAYRTIKSRYAK